jgi:hypothetical protein
MKPNAANRQRLRFEKFTHETGLDARCTVSVRLEWCGEMHEGSAEGLETQQGRLRASSLATIGAVLEAAGERMSLELIGIKAVHAFDGWVVVTSLRAAAADRTYRLLGSASCEEESDLLRAAALSVLDASNRILERHVRP